MHSPHRLDLFGVGWSAAPARSPRGFGECDGATVPSALWQRLLSAPPLPDVEHTPDKGTMSPREACFAFGVANLRKVQGGARPRAPKLAAALRAARPEDCLDAAFCLAGGPSPRDIIRSARHHLSSVPPFHDDEYYAALADWLGCRFDREARVLSRAKLPAIETVLTEDGEIMRFDTGEQRVLAVAPAPRWLPGLAALLCARPQMREQIVIVPAHTIASVHNAEGPSVVRGRIEPLHVVPRNEVADTVLTRAQALTLATALALLIGTILAIPVTAAAGTMVVTMVVLLTYAGVRALALTEPLRRLAPELPRERLRAAQLPIYSVLVPLYREDQGLRHLIGALRRLDYPPDKLDIIFLMEADDPLTAEALERECVGLRCRVIVVPPGLPRTKPRALNVGLRQARGALVTIYDAEDRPEPSQLRVAAETLAAAPPSLAGVQATLAIDHESDNWLTRMFAIEYACLFDHILPMLSRRRRLFLLGGTSNHFRKGALVAVGGWDPYNVTEDADLAVRLYRRGYTLGTIDSATFEEAPVSISAWLKQRARWFKGFAQTWLVHHRNPVRFVREVGWVNAALLNLFIVGALTAALAHLSFTIQLALAGAGLRTLFEGQSDWLIAVQAVAVAAGYGVNVALGIVTLRERGRSAIGIATVVWFPLYWLLMGLAVVTAIHDLIRRPHHWRKTTHGVALRPARIAEAAKQSARARAAAAAAAREASTG